MVPTKSRSLRSLSRPGRRSRPREFASLIRCGSGGVPRWGPQIRAALWGGREKTGAPTRLFLGLVARALSAPPLALGIFPSSGCSFLPGRGVAPRVAGARRVPLAGPVSSAPPPSTARGGVGGSVGAFPGGPAGRWRVSFAQPAVVRAGVRPLPLSGCWAVSLPSALPLGFRPARH